MPTDANPTDRSADRPIVSVRGLRKRFGDNEVLKGIDLAVQRGEVIAIIGKSGSGKSTLLRCINGLEEFQTWSLTPPPSCASTPCARASARTRC